MKPTLNEIDQTERASLRELFVAVKGGDGFNAIKVAGTEELLMARC